MDGEEQWVLSRFSPLLQVSADVHSTFCTHAQWLRFVASKSLLTRTNTEPTLMVPCWMCHRLHSSAHTFNSLVMTICKPRPMLILFSRLLHAGCPGGRHSRAAIRRGVPVRAASAADDHPE